MNTNNKHPHFSRTVLHNGEERVKRIFRDQLAELAGLLEVGISLPSSYCTVESPRQ